MSTSGVKRVSITQALEDAVEETPNRGGAFPRLDEDQRALLRQAGDVRRVSPGEVLYREGDRGYDFFAIESGAVAIVEGFEYENRVIAVQGPHRFLGDLTLLRGATAWLTAVVRDAGEVIQLPAARLRNVLAGDEELTNIILTAYLARRSVLIEFEAGARLIGSRYSRDTRRLREFLARNRVPFHFVDMEEDTEAESCLRSMKVEPGQTPIVVAAGAVLRNPSNAELSARLGLGARGAPPALCDLVIVGGGPAGLAAAVYGASEGLDTQAIDSVAFGGQASTSSKIENYLGFPAGISGSELAERAGLQAAKFGARMVVPAEAASLVREDGHYAIALADGSVVNGRALIIATGARYRKLDVPELCRYEGEGVYYAATQAEAQLCSGSPVLVVGGGNSAGQAAMFLSRHASSCRLLIRGDDLGKSMSRYLVDEIERNERVELLRNTEIKELRGEPTLAAAVLEDTRTGQRREVEAQAVFVFIGASPHTEWLGGAVASDEHGFLLTGREIENGNLTAYNGDQPMFLETSQPGIFAVGDVRSGSIKRCASAVGEGSMAVQLVHERLGG
jgi:thioredoxin reductase (NADPH)